MSRYDDDDDDFPILKDGQSMRVPLRMMDSVQRGVREQVARVTDATGDGSLGLHRPGFRVADASSSVERRRIYDEYDDATTTAWQKPPSIGFVGQREGDLCTIDGAPGHLKKINGELRCVPDSERDAAATMDAIYGEYDRSIGELWKGENR